MDFASDSLFAARSAEHEIVDDTLSITELFTRVKAAITGEFRTDVWVRGEVKSIREWRAAWFLNLVEPGATRGGGDVNVDVACWQRAPIEAQLAAVGITLTAGMEVRVRGTVGISKLGKVQVTLTELDTDALLGKVALEKQRLIQALVTEGLFDRNRSMRLTPVPLRVGLVTSSNSEGHNDFVGQLRRSPFAFSVELRHTSVQGLTAPMQIAEAIRSLGAVDLDLIAVVRGGGGELDAFDKEPVARAIANASVPVFTGIGHTGDRSVADDVAHTAAITPTACGQAIVRLVDAFVDEVGGLLGRVALRSNEQITQAIQRNQSVGMRLLSAARSELSRAEGYCTRSVMALQHGTEMALSRATARLNTIEARLGGFDPQRQLERGFSLTLGPSGAILRSINEITTGASITSRLGDGTLRSTVTSRDVSHSPKDE